MNIFYLDTDPENCAKYHCDVHMKMILESGQLLSTAIHYLDTENKYTTLVYKPTHKNHPSAIWVRTSRDNFNYVLNLLHYLNQENLLRRNKNHKTYTDLYEVFLKFSKDTTINWPESKRTPIPLVMPEKYKGSCAIQSYRNYYIFEKLRLLKNSSYTTREVPKWVTNNKNNLITLA